MESMVNKKKNYMNTYYMPLISVPLVVKYIFSKSSTKLNSSYTHIPTRILIIIIFLSHYIIMNQKLNLPKRFIGFLYHYYVRYYTFLKLFE